MQRISRLTALALATTAIPATIGLTIALAANAHADPAVNLPVTDAVRAQLLNAGAALKGLPASDFTGLAPGSTYYAYDPNTGTYWAGAHLAPSPTSYEAQVSDQDSGTYTLFQQPKGGSWTAFRDGGSGNSGCPAPLPAEILGLWHWNPDICRPAS
jgi:hypothetical protein